MLCCRSFRSCIIFSMSGHLQPISSLSAIADSVLYRDAHCIVLNKPAGIAVHRTPKGDESLEDYFDALRFGQPRRPALAHRLDKETSGCLVLGCHRDALARLGKLFEKGNIDKRYIAVVRGRPLQEKGRFAAPIKRFDLGRGKWEFRCAPDGQEAYTDYSLLASSEEYSLLSLSPLTGRTHQLRLHCQAMGCAIVNDKFYGEGEGPLMLHAYSIVVPYAVKGPAIAVKAPFPSYFTGMMSARKWSDVRL